MEQNDLNQYSNIFIQEAVSEIVICKMAIMSSRFQCVNGRLGTPMAPTPWLVLVFVYPPCVTCGGFEFNDVIMSAMASQITSHTIVYSIIYSGADQRRHQSSTSLAFVRWPVNSPHKGTVRRKMFPFDDDIMEFYVILFGNAINGPGLCANCQNSRT